MEKEVSELIAVPAEGNEIKSIKTKKEQIRTAIEISGGTYRLVKTVWISPLTKTSDILSLMSDLPKEDIQKAEQNFAIDILSKRFKLSKRGGD